MTKPTSNENAVRAHLAKWLEASRAMDIDALRNCYVPDLVSYDCHSAFQFRSFDAYGKHLAMCFSHISGPMTLELHELSIVADDNVAFCHATMRCGCIGTNGAEHWSWLRSTICMKTINGEWLVAHDHCSAPFDPMTSQAMLDAGPEELKKVA